MTGKERESSVSDDIRGVTGNFGDISECSIARQHVKLREGKAQKIIPHQYVKSRFMCEKFQDINMHPFTNNTFYINERLDKNPSIEPQRGSDP